MLRVGEEYSVVACAQSGKHCLLQVMAAYVTNTLSQQPTHARQRAVAAPALANVLELLRDLVRELLAIEVGDHQPFLEVGAAA